MKILSILKYYQANSSFLKISNTKISHSEKREAYVVLISSVSLTKIIRFEGVVIIFHECKELF